MKTILNIKDWSEVSDTDRFNGYSPGGTASALGVSRQMVYRLIRQGKLDVLSIVDLNGAEVGILISTESRERYKASRREYGQRIKNEKENKKKQMGLDYE